MNKGYLPLKQQLSLVFISFIILFFICFCLVFYLIYIKNVESNAKSQIDKLMQQTIMNLDRYVREVDKITLAPYYDNTIMSLLDQNREQVPWKTYINDVEIRSVSSFVDSLSINHREIRDIVFFTNNNMIFAGNNSNVQHTWTHDTCPWMSDVIETDGLSMILPPHEAKYYLLQSPSVISIARLIREPYTNMPLGIIKVDLELSSFETILSSLSLNKNSDLYLFDADSQLLYSNKMPGNKEKIDENTILNVNRGMAVFSIKSKETGMNLIYIVAKSAMIKDGLLLFRLMVIIIALSLAVFCIIAVVISKRLVKPIQALCDNMQQLCNGNLKVRSVVKSRSEIRELEKSFNDMAAKFEWLIAEVYESKLSEQEAALHALQSQLKPHFIYNTLESVQMQAIEDGNIKIADTLASLGKLLRYTIGRYEKQTLLQKELQFIDAYLQVQNVRLKGLLSYVCNVDPSLEMCLVPKLLLQPFFENVIKHAVAEDPVTVYLSAQIIDDALVIGIKNNGIPMSKETAENLQKKLIGTKYFDFSSGIPEHKGGMGLRLIQQQIRVLHGADYGISLCEFETVTHFRIKLPYIWGCDDASDNDCRR